VNFQTSTYRECWGGDQRPLTFQPFDLTDLKDGNTSVPSREGPKATLNLTLRKGKILYQTEDGMNFP